MDPATARWLDEHPEHVRDDIPDDVAEKIAYALDAAETRTTDGERGAA